ncbi:MAG TPA: T9SS type A sorting domain-containing protein, partial [Bacteroidia bacterium]|nr:T9SS type A sorting domain-containing protein [Bacteroidia bacterium]
GSPTVIKKKTIYINCGQSIDLESYNTNYCGGSQFFWSTEPFSANVTLPYNVSPKNNTTYLRYNYNQYCVECIFELSVVVRRPAPKAIEIGIECGQRVNLELISGCSGFEYDWYKENPGGQPIIVVGPSVEPTETGIYYRESKGDCPCKARIKVNVLTPELRTVIISPEQYSCNARPYRFTQGCPTGAGYKQSDLYGPDRYLFFLPILVPLEHLGWSNVSYEDYNIYIPGEYLMVAEYYNGCKCTTKYIVNTLEPPKKYIPIISLCENKSFKPADCSGATTYKWFDWAFTNSIVTDGSITLAQRDDIAAPNNGQYLWRVGYDQFGCIVCVDKFVIGNDTYGYTRIDYKYHNTIEACDGEVIHLDIKKFFTPPFNCSLTLNGTPPPTQQISSIVTSPNGDITIQVNQLTQNISLEFECPGQGDQCPTRVYVDIKKKENCPSGMAAPPNETSIQSEGKKITSLKVYPNPTTSSVKIEMPMFLGISTVKLYDALGRQIFVTETKDSELQLDLSDFSKGIYMLLVENNGVVYTEKVAFE